MFLSKVMEGAVVGGEGVFCAGFCPCEDETMRGEIGGNLRQDLVDFAGSDLVCVTSGNVFAKLFAHFEQPVAAKNTAKSVQRFYGEFAVVGGCVPIPFISEAVDKTRSSNAMTFLRGCDDPSASRSSK